MNFGGPDSDINRPRPRSTIAHYLYPVAVAIMIRGKRPSNGANLADRRSNLRSKGNAWKAQLVQGVKEKEIADALNGKLDEQRQMIRDRKEQMKKEAKALDIELGFVDPTVKTEPTKIPEWKKQKMFLNEIFPPPVICRKYNGVIVYRNKLSMQQYLHRVITPEEWEGNLEVLAAMRAVHDEQKKAEEGSGQDSSAAGSTDEVGCEREAGESCGEQQHCISEEEGDQADGHSEEGGENEEDGEDDNGDDTYDECDEDEDADAQDDESSDIGVECAGIDGLKIV